MIKKIGKIMETIKYCVNCFGTYPCWCQNKKYVKTWKFIYEAIKRLKK